MNNEKGVHSKHFFEYCGHNTSTREGSETKMCVCVCILELTDMVGDGSGLRGQETGQAWRRAGMRQGGKWGHRVGRRDQLRD